MKDATDDRAGECARPRETLSTCPTMRHSLFDAGRVHAPEQPPHA
eukprot:CAMPEP_0184125476 /NCGR_PEP_ID=MMETSP0974-20121125/25052_1 /TAXON_ID=483370 /ORGANISM="non described non described, Strain CCMP2097" /LENGTH=44 /DNA_ID= /DNA_START= /DNA_END= /DNA_ORIENTATION=